MQQIGSAEELEKAVLLQGFLPFFKNNIPGFSIEERTPSDLWFEDGIEGPWEWKGPVIRNWRCVYGKLFCGKAGYVSLEWFSDLANYRRAKYRIEDAPKDNEGTNREKLIYNIIKQHESLLSKEIKILCGFQKPKRVLSNPVDGLLERMRPHTSKGESFETAITRLQMSTLIVVADFEYLTDKRNRPYGWGVARYTTPEALFGISILPVCEKRTPEESKKRLIDYLTHLLPQASDAQILKIIG